MGEAWGVEQTVLVTQDSVEGTLGYSWSDSRGGGSYSVSFVALAETSSTEAGGTVIGPGSGFLAVADREGDGDLDVLAGEPGSFATYSGEVGEYEVLTWYPNVGGGYFDPHGALGVNGALLRPLSVAAADLDSDGFVDPIAAGTCDWYSDGYDWCGAYGYAPHELRWWSGAGDEFDYGTSLASRVEPEFLAAGDLDGDGDADLALGAGASRPGLSVLANEGTGDFAEELAIGASASAAIVLTDLDADGWTDILTADVASCATGVPAWYRSLGAGAFDVMQAIDAACPGSTALLLLHADVDGDGDPDVVQSRESHLGWFENLGGAFSPSLDIAQLEAVEAVVAVDREGDADADLAIGTAGYPAALLLLENAGGTYDAPAILVEPADGVVAPLSAADLDGDGLPEVLTPTTWFGL